MKYQFYVYKFIDKNGIIVYVGRTVDLYRRFKNHEHMTNDVKTIEYIECSSEAEMVWKEIYYINLYYNEHSMNVLDVYSKGKMKPIELNDVWKTYDKSLIPKSNYIVSLSEYNDFMDSLPKYNYKELITVMDRYKLNEIGQDKYALSEKWFATNTNLVLQLKKNITNYFNNIIKTSSENCLWTTYFACKDLLKWKGYTKGYVRMDKYTPGLYPFRTNLTYAANNFYPTIMKDSEITDEQYALYNLLRFMFQSGLYYGSSINIYIPSKRMRDLLTNWINEQNYISE